MIRQCFLNAHTTPKWLTFIVGTLGSGTPALAVEAPVAVADKLWRRQRFHAEHLVDLPERDEPEEHLRRHGHVLALLLAERRQRVFRLLLARIEQSGPVDQDRRGQCLHHAAHALARGQRTARRRDDLLREQFHCLL